MSKNVVFGVFEDTELNSEPKNKIRGQVYNFYYILRKLKF